jgi:putative transposase
MPHSYSKLWIHAVWSTKLRAQLIEPQIEDKVYKCLIEQFKELKCPVRIVNGMPDHVHCLFRMHPSRSVADVIGIVKNKCSAFVNNENLILPKFGWQVGYAAYSVSESMVEIAHGYIKKQKKHHLKQDFADEWDQFILLHGLTPAQYESYTK